MKFRKKPVVVDAVQLTQATEIKTLEGTMLGSKGDWLITGVKGEQYPCRDDIFRATYESVRDEDDQDSVGDDQDSVIERLDRIERKLDYVYNAHVPRVSSDNR